MRIHHLNCVSACPLGGFVMDGMSVGAIRGRLTSHCLLIETDRKLVLIDTGYGTRDVADPRSRLSRFFLMLNSPELREEMTAVRQIEALGYDPRDVRDVVLSHLDFDHAGGLDDFPEATVHLLGDEVAAAKRRSTMLDRMRYRPQQWGTMGNWKSYPLGPRGQTWYGFDHVQPIDGLGADIRFVPLIGHTLGHAGVAVRRDDGGWLLYAADAYFYYAEMRHQRPSCTPGLRFYQTMMEKDRASRLRNQRLLRELRHTHGDEVTLFCAHDVREFEALSGTRISSPRRRTARRVTPRSHQPITAG